MRKEFNVTGSCNPDWHYMVDTAKRFESIENLIEKGKYFTINRARQYGKTTMLNMIWRRLSDKYLVVTFDFSKRKKGSANCETQLDSIEPQWIDWNGKRIFEVIV